MSIMMWSRSILYLQPRYLPPKQEGYHYPVPQVRLELPSTYLPPPPTTPKPIASSYLPPVTRPTTPAVSIRFSFGEYSSLGWHSSTIASASVHMHAPNSVWNVVYKANLNMQMTWIITASSFTIYDGGGHNRIILWLLSFFIHLAPNKIVNMATSMVFLREKKTVAEAEVSSSTRRLTMLMMIHH